MSDHDVWQYGTLATDGGIDIRTGWIIGDRLPEGLFKASIWRRRCDNQ